MMAYAFASGEIGFGPKLVSGALPIASGPERTLKRLIFAAARLAHDNETLLVPGVPEAETPDEAFEALRKWGEWLFTRHPRNCKVFWPAAPGEKNE